MTYEKRGEDICTSKIIRTSLEQEYDPLAYRMTYTGPYLITPSGAVRCIPTLQNSNSTFL